MVKSHLINNSSQIYNYLDDNGIELDDNTHVPIRKVLHSLFKKSPSIKIFKDTSPGTSSITESYREEVEMYNNTCFKPTVFHFFQGDNDKKINEYSSDEYFGFCTLRKDNSIAYAFLWEQIIIREVDSYAYLVCKFTKEIKVDGEKFEIKGFPYVQKDGKVIMCSQSSLSTISEFLNKEMESFRLSASSGVQITRAVNVPRDEIDKAENHKDKTRGLSMPEMKEWLEKENVNYNFAQFSTSIVDSIRSQRPQATLYSYLESGFPVCCIVKTTGNLHALTIIGHTLDRNSWRGIADTGYFDRPLTGEGQYHTNINWARHFLLSDDNLGPYYFYPWENLSEIIYAYIVPLPNTNIEMEPITVERAAFQAITEFCIESQKDSKSITSYEKALSKFNNSDVNKKLGQQFLMQLEKHERHDETNLVLRTIFVTREEILNEYQSHEFQDQISEVLPDQSNKYFGYVEISWPDLFCYHRKRCGSIIIDPERGNVSSKSAFKHIPFVHLPGVCWYLEDASNRSTYQKEYANDVDNPFQHYMPSGQH